MSLVFLCDRNLGKRFGQILRDLGLDVKLHDEHFPPDYPDEALLQDVAKRAWILLTFDHRMRRNPVEKDWADHLARAFHQAQGKVEAFFQRHSPPVVARFEININKSGRSRFSLRRVL